MGDFLYGFLAGWAFNYSGVGSLIVGIAIGMALDRDRILKNEFLQNILGKIRDGLREKAS